MFRKETVLSAGNYRSGQLEDYDLWVRILLAGGTIANIPEVLVKMRSGEDLYGRRGGVNYLFEEIKLFRRFWSWGFISLLTLVMALCIRIPVRLAPTSLRKRLYERRLRTETPS